MFHTSHLHSLRNHVPRGSKGLKPVCVQLIGREVIVEVLNGPLMLRSGGVGNEIQSTSRASMMQ